MTANAKVVLPTVGNPTPAQIQVQYLHCLQTALVVVVPKNKLKISGPTKSWAGKADSGNTVHRIFCSECGSPIAHDPEGAPEIIAIKGGTLDTAIKQTLKPVSWDSMEIAGFW